MVKQWVFDSALAWLHWVAGEIISGLGWSGMAVVIAGGIFFLSLSANAVKFFRSPRGLAASAGVTLAAIAFIWWSWPKAEAAVAASEPAAVRQPEIRTASKRAAPAKVRPVPEPAPVALALRRETDAPPAVRLQQDLPLIPFIPPVTFAVPAPVRPVPVHVPPVVRLPDHKAAHHAPVKPHHPAAATRRSGAGSLYAAAPAQAARGGSQAAGIPGQHLTPKQLRAAKARDYAEEVRQSNQMIINSGIGSPWAIGHHIGMGHMPMGGAHMGAHPGMGHPAGGMHHPGGHN